MNIVVVEDELIIGMMIRLMLEKMGCSVTGMASKGKDAISLVESTRPDLVLMDIWLKGSMDGIETATQIREKYGIPIVFVTADSSKEARKRADLAGHQAFLTKPIIHEDLQHVIHSVFYNSSDNGLGVNSTKPILCKT